MINNNNKTINKNIIIKENKIKNNIYKKKETSYNYNNNYYLNKKYILNIINNNNYCSILYLMLDKGFTFHKEILHTIGINGIDYLNVLKNNNIIESYNLTDNESKFIKKMKPNTPLKRMKFFKLTINTKDIITCDFLYDIFMDSVKYNAKQLKNNQLLEYSKLLQDEEEIKQKEELEWKLKLKSLRSQGVIIEDNNHLKINTNIKKESNNNINNSLENCEE